MSFAGLWQGLLPAGRDERTGGYRRLSWTAADARCRAWFMAAAAERALRAEPDRNGNLWAWWDPPGAAADATGPAIVTGSHLDSVPAGGAFDGALGVASAFAAIDLLRARGVVPSRPVAVAAFTEEEGSRFGVACLGSRLMMGTIDATAARSLRDGDGVPLPEAMAAAGADPALIGPDPDRLARIGVYVELHIEQGLGLARLGAPVGIGERIWPHGRWRLEFTGRADHAGTAALADRRDPLLPLAETVLAARRAAASHGALATIGKVITEPGAANAVASRARAWLDARAAAGTELGAVVADVLTAARGAASAAQVELAVTQESATAAVEFDPALRARVAASLGARGIHAPVLVTGAGHDAGILAAGVPTAMLFVRNPTGVSHSPAERAELADCEMGVAALAAVLTDLACEPAWAEPPRMSQPAAEPPRAGYS